MASFTAGTTFVDGVANDVTAAKLGALVTAALPTSGFIQDRTAETVVATNDTFLIGDASDSNTLKRMTVANVMKAELTGTINTTAGTITTLNSTTGTITGLNSTTGTVATLNSTTGTITTGVIPTLTSITKITSGTGTAAAPAISPTGDTNTGIFFPAADTIAFSEGGTEAMRIDLSGNVGIGTTAPGAKLDISAGVAGGSHVGPSLRLTNGYSDFGAGDWVPNTDYAGSVDYYTVDASGTGPNVVSFIRPYVQTVAGAGWSLAFGVSSSNEAATERMRIASSGNVGIGEANPATKLHIESTGEIIRSETTSAMGNNYLTFYKSGGTRQGYIGYAGGSNDVLTINNERSEDIYFYTSGTFRMNISAAGNVGIGTASPTGQLHVIGSTGAGASAGNSIKLIAGAGGPTAGTGGDIILSGGANGAGGANGNVIFQVGGTEYARINSSGNVSIGTATALSKLHVHGDLTMSNATTAITASTSTITPPATVAGYLTVSINGTSRKIPYYAT